MNETAGLVLIVAVVAAFVALLLWLEGKPCKASTLPFGVNDDEPPGRRPPAPKAPPRPAQGVRYCLPLGPPGPPTVVYTRGGAETPESIEARARWWGATAEWQRQHDAVKAYEARSNGLLADSQRRDGADASGNVV